MSWVTSGAVKPGVSESAAVSVTGVPETCVQVIVIGSPSGSLACAGEHHGALLVGREVLARIDDRGVVDDPADAVVVHHHRERRDDGAGDRDVVDQPTTAAPAA